MAIVFFAHDALRDGRLRHQVRARDLRSSKAAEQPQRQRDPSLHAQHRVTRREDQSQQVVVDVIGKGAVEVDRLAVARDFEIAAELGVLVPALTVASEPIDRGACLPS